VLLQVLLIYIWLICGKFRLKIFINLFFSDESDAEENCENALRDALIVDKDNIDALQSLTNLRMVRDKDKEAKQHITKVF
jgi:hypothetical protein